MCTMNVVFQLPIVLIGRHRGEAKIATLPTAFSPVPCCQPAKNYGFSKILRDMPAITKLTLLTCHSVLHFLITTCN